MRTILALALLAASAAGWLVTHDDLSEPGTAILGGWRDRWFLLNVGLSYLALWVAIWAWLRPSREALMRAVAVHLGVAFPIVVAELTAVAGIVDFRSLRAIRGAFREGGPDLPDPRLRAASVPDLHAVGEQPPDLVSILGAEADPIRFDFATDSHGLRNPREKPDPAVVCLGDSMLAAGLVPTDEIVTERFERALGVSVLNVGEPAYSPQEELVRFETTGVGASGRLVVHFLFEGNDLTDSNRWLAWRSAGDVGSGSDWPQSGLLRYVLELLHRPKRGAGALRSGTLPGPGGRDVRVWFLYDAHGVAAEMHGWPAIAEALVAANREILTAGGRYALVLIPSKLTVLHPLIAWSEGSTLRDPDAARSPLPLAIAKLARDEAIPFVDLTSALRASAERGALPYFAADTHLDATGHAALAETLTPWVREQLAELRRETP